MIKTKDDGGPAFPGAWHPDMGWSAHETPWGMSLRDWLAGQVLPTFLSKATANHSIDAIAVASYEMADAMIKARSR